MFAVICCVLCCLSLSASDFPVCKQAQPRTLSIAAAPRLSNRCVPPSANVFVRCVCLTWVSQIWPREVCCFQDTFTDGQPRLLCVLVSCMYPRLSYFRSPIHPSTLADAHTHVHYELSVHHNAVPALQGYVRAEIFLLAHVLRPVKDKPNEAELTIISQVYFLLVLFAVCVVMCVSAWLSLVLAVCLWFIVLLCCRVIAGRFQGQQRTGVVCGQVARAAKHRKLWCVNMHAHNAHIHPLTTPRTFTLLVVCGLSLQASW